MYEHCEDDIECDGVRFISVPFHAVAIQPNVELTKSWENDDKVLLSSQQHGDFVIHVKLFKKDYDRILKRKSTIMLHDVSPLILSADYTAFNSVFVYRSCY